MIALGETYAEVKGNRCRVTADLVDAAGVKLAEVTSGWDHTGSEVLVQRLVTLVERINYERTRAETLATFPPAQRDAILAALR